MQMQSLRGRRSEEQPNDTNTDGPSPSSSESCNWLELPPEVTATILHKVGAFDILNHAQKVCTSWLNVCKDPSMWRSIDIHDSNAYGDYWLVNGAA
uniref:F-box domain-containing protein n=1 Tax=Kalanchoe fedtschenkoi TaxID=63787 RepID=A0A7N0VJV3_KALFE